MKNYTFRLKPGHDLIDSIVNFVQAEGIEAGCVISAVGSLTHATLRLANQDIFNEYDGYFEIVSITGLVSIHGSHLHIAISDSEGQTIGGHLVSGCKVYTTAEIAILEFDNEVHRREYADDSGYDELVVYKS